MNWQPIETAPRDGTVILGAYCMEGETDWYGIVCFLSNWYEGPSWVDQFHDESWMEPSHWIALEPPQ